MLMAVLYPARGGTHSKTESARRLKIQEKRQGGKKVRKKSTDENNLQLCLTSIEPKKKKRRAFSKGRGAYCYSMAIWVVKFFWEGYKIR